MHLDSALDLLEKYTRWSQEVSDFDLSPPLDWDKKYFEESIQLLRLLESKELIPGYSQPPYLHSRCGDYPFVWMRRIELISGIAEKLNTTPSEHWEQAGFGDMNKDLQHIVDALENIRKDGIDFHVKKREIVVSQLEGTQTEYITDMYHDYAEEILNYFCRNDMKNKPFFIEFQTSTDSNHKVTLRENEYEVIHLLVTIANGNHPKEEMVEFFGRVREIIGLPAKLDNWEIDPFALFQRIQSGIDEYTLAHRIFPEDGLFP